MNEEQNEIKLPESDDRKLDSISAKRVRRDKWLSGIFVSVLVILCLAVACSLYILSKDYLAWSANKHKAQSELEQLQAISDKQRSSIDEELKRLELQKQERLNELAALKERTSKLNSQIAQREAQLNSTDEEVKRLDKIKAEAKNLSAQNKQFTAEIDKQRQELSQLTGQKTVLAGHMISILCMVPAILLRLQKKLPKLPVATAQQLQT